MVNHSRVIVSKNLLKRCLVENEDISKSLSRFIDNSINARKEVTTIENPCEINISVFENLIIISDNSGGINSRITDKDVFKIGSENGEISGLGIKKSLFRLGNRMEMLSNRKECSRKIVLDINWGSVELMFQSEDLEYDPDLIEGTRIYISDLDSKTSKEIRDVHCLDNILLKLGRMYSKFIKRGELIISVNKNKVIAKDIEAVKIASCKILGDYIVDLYKGSKVDLQGVDLFINDYMIYDREKSNEVKWNLLNEAKHTYKDCIVEICYYGELSKYNKEKEVLFTEVINFIKENKVYFQSKTITIQYEMSIEKVEDLKAYYDEDTAKAIGIKAFNRLYENFLQGNMRNNK